MLKKNHISSIIEQLQRDNDKLKSISIDLRKQLKAYQDLMINQLMQIDQQTLIYDTPYDCLKAFIHHFKHYSHNVNTHQHLNQELTNKIRQLEHKLQIQRENNAQNARSSEQNHQKLMRMQARYKQDLKSMEHENIELKLRKQQLQLTNLQIKNEYEKKEISLDEQKRIVLSSIAVKHRKEIDEMRESIEIEHIEQTQKYRLEIKTKDETIKKIVKGLQKLEGQEIIQKQEMNQIKAAIKQIGNIQELINTINEQKDQTFALKKEIKDLKIKKVSLEAKISELKTQIASFRQFIQVKNAEIAKLNEEKLKLSSDLRRQMTQNKKLQFYFEQKWHNQFEKVRVVLQRTYHQKIRENTNEYQKKKQQVARNLEMYLRLHNQALKSSQNSKKQIQQLQESIKKLQQKNREHVLALCSYENQMNEFNSMVLQYQQSCCLQKMYFSKEKTKQIVKLSEQIQRLHDILNNEEKHIQNVIITFRLQFNEQKEAIQIAHEQQIQQLAKKHEEEINVIVSRQNEMIQRKNMEIAQMRREEAQRILEMKERNGKQMEVIFNTLKAERIKNKSLHGQVQVIQNQYKEEIHQIKTYLNQKVQDLQSEIVSKTKHLRIINQKSQNDETLKEQLRQLVEVRNNEIAQLTTLKLYLQEQTQKKDTELSKFKKQNEVLMASKNNVFDEINKVKTGILKELTDNKATHQKLVRIYRSKIFQLENIISKRPIRLKDEEKIRSLTLQKQELQNKVDKKQAENIVLKQIKYIYERKQESKSEVNIAQPEYKQNHSILIFNRRPRPFKIGQANSTFNLHKQEESQSQIDRDVKKMKRYLMQKDRSKLHEKSHVQEKTYKTNSTIRLKTQ